MLKGVQTCRAIQEIKYGSSSGGWQSMCLKISRFSYNFLGLLHPTTETVTQPCS